MQCKGVNQIDFAVAISILITVFVLTITFVTNYYDSPRQVLESSKLYIDALDLEQTAFQSRGVPPYWQFKNSTTRPSLASDIWYKPIHVRDKYGDGFTGDVSVDIDPGESWNLSNAWTGSVVVYDGTEIIESNVQGSDRFTDDFELEFSVDLDSYESRTYDVYYSQDNFTSYESDSLNGENHEDIDSIEINKMSERSLLGLTPYKLYLVDNYIDRDEIRDKYDLDRNFNITVYTDEGNLGYGNFTMGSDIPELADTETYSQKIIYQNSSAHINRVNVEVTVW